MTSRCGAWRAELAFAALSGVTLTLAFPGVDLGLLAWVALAPWLAWIPGRSPGRAALGGLVAGLAFHVGGLW